MTDLVDAFKKKKNPKTFNKMDGRIVVEIVACFSVDCQCLNTLASSVQVCVPQHGHQKLNSEKELF